MFLNARGGRLTRQGAWLVVRAAGDKAGLSATACSPTCSATRARPTCSTTAPTSGGAGAARPRQPLDHAGVHEGVAGTAAGRLRRRPPPGAAAVAAPRGAGNAEDRRRGTAVALDPCPTRSHAVLRDQLQEERDRLRRAASRRSGAARPARLRRELRRLGTGHRRARRDRCARGQLTETLADIEDALPSSTPAPTASASRASSASARRGSRRCPRRASASPARRSAAASHGRRP